MQWWSIRIYMKSIAPLQDVEGENYLGIQLLRFYFRCAACSAEFILKTDPANTDYTMEKGATRNYEPWREKEKDVAQAVADRDEEERGNAMKVGRALHKQVQGSFQWSMHAPRDVCSSSFAVLEILECHFNLNKKLHSPTKLMVFVTQACHTTLVGSECLQHPRYMGQRRTYHHKPRIGGWLRNKVAGSVTICGRVQMRCCSLEKLVFLWALDCARIKQN